MVSTLGVDFVAISFVQTADDVVRAKQLMANAGRSVPIIAKIERPTAIENLNAILREVHGVMVARGDLGLEMPLEQIPRVQKQIIECARALGRPVIVATQVLESMRESPRPTRAEVSDAANAVEEGADAIMLAGETAAGQYPLQAVADTQRASSKTPNEFPPNEWRFRPTRSRAGMGWPCARPPSRSRQPVRPIGDHRQSRAKERPRGFSPRCVLPRRSTPPPKAKRSRAC